MAERDRFRVRLMLGTERARPELAAPSFTVSSVRGGDLLITSRRDFVAVRRPTSQYVAVWRPRKGPDGCGGRPTQQRTQQPAHSSERLTDRQKRSDLGFWLAGQDSNLQPPDPKSGVLPVELPAMGVRTRLPAGPTSAAGRHVRSEVSDRREDLTPNDLQRGDPPHVGHSAVGDLEAQLGEAT